MCADADADVPSGAKSPRESFDYGPTRPDGQHTNHPGLPAEDLQVKAPVRPVRHS